MIMVKEHEIIRTLREVVIDPEHASRRDTPEFRASKERLKADGHFQCKVCGTTEELEVHHHGCEWMFETVVDFDKLKTYCEENDPYGYGQAMKDLPMTTVDDLRNLQVLCKPHHTGKETGIHNISGPTWNIQMLAKTGFNPIPGEG